MQGREAVLNTQLRNTAPTVRQAIEEPSTSTNAVLEAISNVSHEMGFLEASCKDEKPMASVSDGKNTFTPTSQCERRTSCLKQVQSTLKWALNIAEESDQLAATIPNPLYEELFKEKIAVQADLRTAQSSCKA